MNDTTQPDPSEPDELVATPHDQIDSDDLATTAIADRPTFSERWETDWVELVATVALAIAAILTAWSAFQSAKWSGEQATSFSKAGAARTESTRADTTAGQLISIDVTLFVQWVSALNSDINDGSISPEISTYTPTKGTVSGFLFDRFRDEFKPAMDAWLATDPPNNPDAPPTPFAMEEYVVEQAVIASQLQEEANAFADDAGTANQTSDNYVLTAVLFATVLFFAGVSSKLSKATNRAVLVGISVLILIVASVIVLSLPKLY